jgi:hypothetical protein
MDRNVFVADHSLSRSFHYRCDARAEGLGQRVPSINHGGHVWKADNVSECDQDGEFHGLMERSHRSGAFS